jgi:hypothetical protein
VRIDEAVDVEQAILEDGHADRDGNGEHEEIHQQHARQTAPNLLLGKIDGRRTDRDKRQQEAHHGHGHAEHHPLGLLSLDRVSLPSRMHL